MPVFELYDHEGILVNRISCDPLDIESFTPPGGRSIEVLTSLGEAEIATDIARRNMVVHRRAFKLALLHLAIPPYASLLDALEDQMVGLGTRDPLVMAMQDVTVFERSHPDMEDFRVKFGLSPRQMDAIFSTAIAIENRESEDDIASAMAGFYA